MCASVGPVSLTREHRHPKSSGHRIPNSPDLCFLIPTCFISFQSNHAHAPVFLSSNVELKSIWGRVALCWSTYLTCVSLCEILGSIPASQEKKESGEIEFWLHSLPELDLDSLRG